MLNLYGLAVCEGDVSTQWLTLDLARHLMKGYTVYRSQENHTRPIRDTPTNLLKKAARFFLLLASVPRVTWLEVHQVFLKGNERNLR